MKTTETFTYHKGDKAQYTGKTEVLHGDVCHEAVLTEGHRKGQTIWTYREPGHVGAYTGPAKKA